MKPATFCFCTALALAVALPARGADLTTYYETGSQRFGRYLVNLGRDKGHTARSQTATDGIFDFPKYAGNNSPWYMMNDGDTSSGSPCTFLHSDPGANEEFFGYKFKAAATVESLELVDYSFGDGGRFTNDTPVIHVLTGSRNGTWTAVGTTWSPSYIRHGAGGAEANSYVITLNVPASNVWGVRVYGGANPMDDPSGFVACRELKVNGTAFGNADLGENLAQIGSLTSHQSLAARHTKYVD